MCLPCALGSLLHAPCEFFFLLMLFENGHVRVHLLLREVRLDGTYTLPLDGPRTFRLGRVHVL